MKGWWLIEWEYDQCEAEGTIAGTGALFGDKEHVFEIIRHAIISDPEKAHQSPRVHLLTAEGKMESDDELDKAICGLERLYHNLWDASLSELTEEARQ